ncbi:MAG TPA: hypothetical protein DCL35_04545 [Candidatus Omnitrophica bacterium]|nr:hypothetical protein [Candidatus Omnitrophota bacterium]
MVKTISLIAAIILPLWNIPLIVRIQKRRSSEDISLFWAVGVWVCLVLMFPSAVTSQDIIFKTFSIINIVLFSAVTFQVVKFREKGVLH